MEDDLAVDAGKSSSFCKDGARLVLSTATMVGLVWVVRSGYKLAMEAKGERGSHGSEHSFVALMFGVVTVVFGSVYFIVGLTMVAGAALDLLSWFTSTDMETAHDDQGKEKKTISQLIIQTSVILGSMLMLSWAIYHGHKLAMEAPKGGIYNGLAFLIGFIAMGFGFIYFLLGIGIVAESILCLSSRLKHVMMKSDNFHDQDDYDDAYQAV